MKNNRRRSAARRGFAMIVAITLLALAGSALAVMGTMFAGEARRTRSMTAQTQLRQLLVAGEAIAQSRAATGTSTAVEVSLPAELGDGTLTISGPSANPHIEAGFLGQHAEQVVVFVKEGSGWRIAEARLQ